MTIKYSPGNTDIIITFSGPRWDMIFLTCIAQTQVECGRHLARPEDRVDKTYTPRAWLTVCRVDDLDDFRGFLEYQAKVDAYLRVSHAGGIERRV
jgi:hypothetical protein